MRIKLDRHATVQQQDKKKNQYLHVILAVKCSTQGVWRARLKKTVILYVGTKNLEFEEGENQEGTNLKKKAL